MYKEGDLLLKCKPFVFVLGSKLRTQRCDACFKSGEVLKCSGCRYVYYCGRDCQKDVWKDHKPECQNLRKILPKVLPDAARMLAKIILKLKRGGGQEKDYYTKTSFRMFKDLMSHYSDIKKDQKRMEHFSALCGVLTDFLGPELIPNPAELMGLYGRILPPSDAFFPVLLKASTHVPTWLANHIDQPNWGLLVKSDPRSATQVLTLSIIRSQSTEKMCVNSFNILDPDAISIGTGIYLGASIVDHSCDPNAVAVFSGTEIHIRAIKNIPEPIDWTKVFISYIELLQDPVERQMELQGSYYFLCQCNRCEDEENTSVMRSMACSSSKCTASVPVDNIENNGILKNCASCPKCNAVITEEHYSKFKEVTEFTKMHLENMKDIAYLDVCKICLKKQEGILHPLNIFHVRVLDLAFESSIQMNDWEDAVKFGDLCIPGYRKYYGLKHPLYGILLLKLGKINLYLEKYRKAVQYLEEAEKVIRVTHGRDHSLYRSDLLPLWHQAKTGA